MQKSPIPVELLINAFFERIFPNPDRALHGKGVVSLNNLNFYNCAESTKYRVRYVILAQSLVIVNMQFD